MGTPKVHVMQLSDSFYNFNQKSNQKASNKWNAGTSGVHQSRVCELVCVHACAYVRSQQTVEAKSNRVNEQRAHGQGQAGEAYRAWMEGTGPGANQAEPRPLATSSMITKESSFSSVSVLASTVSSSLIQ